MEGLGIETYFRDPYCLGRCVWTLIDLRWPKPDRAAQSRTHSFDQARQANRFSTSKESPMEYPTLYLRISIGHPFEGLGRWLKMYNPKIESNLLSVFSSSTESSPLERGMGQVHGKPFWTKHMAQSQAEAPKQHVVFACLFLFGHFPASSTGR